MLLECLHAYLLVLEVFALPDLLLLQSSEHVLDLNIVAYLLLFLHCSPVNHLLPIDAQAILLRQGLLY